MARIKVEARKLPVLEKCQKGRTIIDFSTDNPNVAGNAEVLAAFAAANEKLARVHAAILVLQSDLKQKFSEQAAALREWNDTLVALAGFTQAATGGDAGGILSTGFGVRDPRSTSKLLPAPENVRVIPNGTPGHSLLRWPRVKGAAAYVIEGAENPTDAASWQPAGISTKARQVVNGATPGREHWYRVAAVNAEGRGPWSMPALRPVM